MEEQMINERSELTGEYFFKEMKRDGNFDVLPCNNTMNIEADPQFKNLKLSSLQKIQVAALARQLSVVMPAHIMTNACVLRFPDGLPHTMAALKQKQDLFDYPAIDQNGIVMPAYTYRLTTQKKVLKSFSAISVISSQHFLNQVHNALNKIKLDQDEILEFLYGVEKADLISEVNFVKSAYLNFSSIMANKSHRFSTASGLQQARKSAIRNSELYLDDLKSIVNSDNPDNSSIVENAIKIKESIELALQLCVMTTIMETYYVQNFDTNYLNYVERDISFYIEKCAKSMLSYFTALQTNVHKAKKNIFKKVNKTLLEKKVGDAVNELNDGGYSELRKSLRYGLNLPIRQSEYYLGRDGSIYIKTE